MERFTRTHLGMVMMATGALLGCITGEAAANPFYVIGSGINTGVSYVTSPLTGYVCQNGTCRSVHYGLFPRPAYGAAPAVYYRPAAPVGRPAYYSPNHYLPGNSLHYSQPWPNSPSFPSTAPYVRPPAAQPLQQPLTWDTPPVPPTGAIGGSNAAPTSGAQVPSPFYP